MSFWLNEGFDQGNRLDNCQHLAGRSSKAKHRHPQPLQANVFLQAPLPAPHRWHHDAAPAIINGSGKQNPFTHDGI